MFQGITPIAQIIIAISAGIALTLTLLIVYRRGVRAGKSGISIPGEKRSFQFQVDDLEIVIDIIFQSLQDVVELNESKRLERKMIFVEEKLVIIRGMKEQLFYKLLKNSGVEQDNLTSHVDAVYFVQVLNNAIYHDNGDQCLKTLFRRVLKSDEYRDFDELDEFENRARYEGFLESFFRASLQKWKRFFYNNYKSKIVDETGNPLVRRITNEDIYEIDFLESHLKKMKEIYKEVFDYARIIDAKVDKEKAELFSDRKNNIRKILGRSLTSGG